jgi:aspartyl-tRNA(Asn)/glutamyl-tRNA(Gln) amidotransferase subunit B
MRRFEDWESLGRLRGFSRVFDVITDLDLWQDSDRERLLVLAREVCGQLPKAVADRAVGFLVGQAMRMSKGKANPALLKSILEGML